MAVIRGSSHAVLLGEKGRISFCSNKSKQPACQARLCPYVTSPLALAPREGAHRSVPLVLGAACAGAIRGRVAHVVDVEGGARRFPAGLAVGPPFLPFLPCRAPWEAFALL